MKRPQLSFASQLEPGLPLNEMAKPLICKGCRGSTYCANDTRAVFARDGVGPSGQWLWTCIHPQAQQPGQQSQCDVTSVKGHEVSAAQLLMAQHQHG